MRYVRILIRLRKKSTFAVTTKVPFFPPKMYSLLSPVFSFGIHQNIFEVLHVLGTPNDELNSLQQVRCAHPSSPSSKSLSITQAIQWAQYDRDWLEHLKEE